MRTDKGIATNVIFVVIVIIIVGGIAAYLATRPAPGPPEKKYEGITIKLAIMEQAAGSVDDAVKEFEETTGCKVIVDGLSYDALRDKLILQAIAGAMEYDIISNPAIWAGAYIDGGYVIPLTDAIENHPEYDWEDLTWAAKKLATYGEEIYMLPVGMDTHLLYYREDLFEDPAEQTAFKEKYGYDLKAPETLDQYLDIAEFFNRDTDDDGKIDFWGSGWNCTRDQNVWWWLYVYYTLGGEYVFDPETMEPRINSPVGVAATEYILEIIDIAPPGVLGWGYPQCFESFYTGMVAMSTPCNWPDTPQLAEDPELSTISGKWGSAPVPGSYEVWDWDKGDWVTKDEIYRRTPVMHGWNFLVTEASAHKDAAIEFAIFVSGREYSKTYMLEGYGHETFRRSHYSDPELRTKFYNADKWLDILASSEGFNPWVDLRTPGATEYHETLAVQLAKAYAGESSPQEALDAAAAEWEKITERYGRSSQLNAFRSDRGIS